MSIDRTHDVRRLLVVASAMLLVLAGAARAGTLQGRVRGPDGRPVAGAMVSLTDASRGLGESVYTDAAGRYRLATRHVAGRLALRVRLAYFRDWREDIELPAARRLRHDIRLEAMSDPAEISDSLPAAYHFGRIRFQDGTTFARDRFQRDCLTCHQVGNALTRVPRDAAAWEVTIERMHKYLGNFDVGLRQQRAQLLASAFDGRPLEVRPRFDFDPAVAHAHLTQYRLDRAQLPHDAEISPVDGLAYIADQFGDQIIVTDLESGRSRYFPVSQQGMNVGGKFARLGIPALGDAAARLYRGPHSLAIGPDGRWYTTDTFATDIGVFDPHTASWEPVYEIPDGSRMPSLYPHTIRFGRDGKAWFTLAFSEQIGRLDPVSRKVDVIDLPPGKSLGVASGTVPYGIDIDPRDGSVWYARLWADRIGRIDPHSLAVTEFDSPVKGPRRLRFGHDGTLWLTGYSDGVIAEIHTAGTAALRSSVHALPEFAPGYRPAAYALAVAPATGHVWVNETMTDRLYRYDPRHGRWTVYPLPLRGSYTREISFTRRGEVCTSNNPFPVGALEGGVAELICIDPGR
ncbi:MAG: carboxypeptidase regulatory-like domain-containing protein [Steroidobacteraceae bacterium]